MNKNDLQCHIDANFAEVLRQIDRNARGIVCLVNDAEEVLGILTDGDVRRALLRGCTLDSGICDHVNYNFSWMPVGLADEDYAGPLFENKYSHVIILDDSKKLVAVLTRQDLHIDNLPVASINLAGNELKYVTQCIRTNWISSQGKFVTEFERAFGDYHDMPYALTTTNGTTALHLALLGIGIGPGDEVIVPVSTFGATANAVIHAGGTPVFVDVEPDTWCIDPLLIEAAITERTRAIIPVHLYGHPANMPEINAVASRRGLSVIEDCAESLGARIDSQLTGTMSDVSCFSFFSNKVITTGEGGMVLTRSESIYRKMKQYRDHGTSLTRKYWHDFPGYNYRMTNIQAAIGLAQMERIEDFLVNRLRVAKRYEDGFQGVKGVSLPVTRENTVNIFWLYTIEITDEFPLSRNDLIELLQKEGIDTRPFFPALFHQPAYGAFSRAGNFPVGLRMERNGLSLPTSNYLGLKDIDRVCNAVRLLAGEKRR